MTTKMKNQIVIYTTQDDLSTIAMLVSAKRPLQFVIAGLFDDNGPILMSDLTDSLPCSTYLAFDKGANVAVRPIPQRNGGLKYAIDQLENLHTVVLQSGGLVDGKRLIAGQIGTTSIESNSVEIYTLFAKEVRRKFEKIKSYYVGPEAGLFLDGGGRLTPTAKSPETYDLRR